MHHSHTCDVSKHSPSSLRKVYASSVKMYDAFREFSELAERRTIRCYCQFTDKHRPNKVIFTFIGCFDLFRPIVHFPVTYKTHYYELTKLTDLRDKNFYITSTSIVTLCITTVAEIKTPVAKV